MPDHEPRGERSEHEDRTRRTPAGRPSTGSSPRSRRGHHQRRASRARRPRGRGRPPWKWACDGHEEERRQPNRAERLGRHHLEQHEQREVHGRHDRIQRELRRAPREEQDGHASTGAPSAAEHERPPPRSGRPSSDQREQRHEHRGDDAGGREHLRSGPPTRSEARLQHQAGGAGAGRSAQLQRRDAGARRVDQPSRRGRAVATLDERLVELVGRGVGARDRGTRRAPPGAAPSPGSSARHHRQRRAARTRRSGRACGRSGRSCPSPESRLGWAEKKKISAISDQRRSQSCEAPERRHPHTVESTAVLVITTKSPYAVRALAELARRGDAAPVPIGEIARARDIPVQFLEGLFATLRRAGILQSQRGVKGGYSFARPPAEVTRARGGRAARGRARRRRRRPRAPSGPRPSTRSRSVLGGSTIADVAEREAQAAAAPMYYI